MPKNLDLTKHTLHLRAGDYAYLSTLCESKAIAVSQVIRSLISKFVDERRATDKPVDLGDLE